MSVFEVLAKTDDDTDRGATRAAIAAQERVRAQFGAFVAKASDEGEADVRRALVDEEIRGIAAQAAAEYDGDAGRAYLAATAVLGGKHPADCTCGFCENKGQFGKKDDDGEDDDGEKKEASMIKEAPGSQHMKGVSPKRNRQYEHIKEQLMEGGKSEAEAKEEAARTVNKQRAEHGETKGSSVKTACSCGKGCDCSPESPCGHAGCSNAKEAKTADKKHWIQDAVKRPGQLHRDLGVPEGEKIPEEKLEEAENSDDPKERERAQFAENMKGLNKKKKGAWQVVAVDVEEGDSYLKERVSLPSSETGVGDPSPKIDKGNSGDETGWDLPEIPELSNSKRHQQEFQDAPSSAEYNDPDFDPSSPVRERVDADKAMQPELWAADNTKTWSGTEGQADPVTSDSINQVAASFQSTPTYQVVSIEG